MKISISNYLRKCGSIALFLVVTACQDDNEKPAMSGEEAKLQAQLAAEETNELISFSQEAMEISSDVLEAEGVTDGRASKSVASKKGYAGHHGCDPDVTTSYDVDLSHRDSVIYTGFVTVNYGEGASCNPGHVRKGKITNKFKYIHVIGNRRAWAAVETFTFYRFVKDSTYTNGGIQITSREGVKALKFALTLIDYRDNEQRQSNARLTFSYHSNESFRWKDNTITVTGRTSGINRHGNAYECFIVTPLLYKYACDKHHRFYPVQGTVKGFIDAVEFFISYGEGDCDKIYSITINGETTENKFSEDGDD